MLNQNTKEYEIIREAIEANRQRLTTHLSFAIGGSGILYIAMNNYLSSDNINLLGLGLIYMFSAMIISSFFYLALYKFNSINRYAGYSKLINLEIKISALKEKQKITTDQIITWEVCMGKLYNSKVSKELDENTWNNELKYKNLKFKNINSKFKEYELLEPEVHKKRAFKGMWMLIKGIFKKDKSKSWKYPLYSSYVYYILISFFMLVSLISTHSYYYKNCDNGFENLELFQLSMIGILCIINFYVIFRSFGEMYKLMLGKKTVSAYCWSFLPHRIKILNEFNIEPHYYNTEN